MEISTNSLNNDELVCPNCGGENLHHGTVTVYERDREDSATGRIVSTEDYVVANTSMKGNPSARRNGLLIGFKCEHCDADPVLAITQHKGCTYFHWASYRKDEA
ncbi:MAG: hypothetical protein GXY45_10565 [Ramlibacter sp.]|nr:hypothetical protein [Ramlibacter sp.]